MNLLQIIIRSIAFLCLLIIFTTPAVTAATISVHKKLQKKKGADEIALFSKKRKPASASELISIDSTRISQELVEPTHDADFNNKYLPVFGVGNDNEIRPTSLRTRGLSQFANAIGLRSSNLIVVDGEVLPRQSMKNLSIADVIRVEAWRGPQGTSFGQNASAGVIQYETRRPEIGEFLTRVSVQTSQYNDFETKLALAMPLGERWAARLNAQRRDAEGWIRNVFPGGDDVGAESAQGLRGQLLFDSDENYSFLFRMDYSEGASNCCGSVVEEVDFDFGPNPVVRIDDGVVSASSYNKIDPEPSFQDYGYLVTSKNTAASYQYFENTGFSAELNYTFENGIPLNYLASYRDYEVHSNLASSPFKFPLERESRAGTEGVAVIQQELSLSSIGDKVLSWVVGVFFHGMSGSRSEITDACVGGAGASAHGLIEDGQLVGCVTRDSALAFIDDYELNGREDRSLLRADRNLSSAYFTSDFMNTAIYGQFGYQVTPRLSATFGLRALYEKGAASFASLWLRPPEDGTGLESFAEVSDMASEDWSLIRRDLLSAEFSDANSSFVYKSVLGYHFSDGVRAYVNYSTGYKGPSFHVTSNTNVDEVVAFPTRPEISTNFEMGLKTALFADRVLFDITYFDMAIEDYQVQAQLLAGDSNAAFGGYTNAEEVRSRGIEADMVYKFTDRVKLIGSYAQLDAAYESFAGVGLACPAGNLQNRCSVENGKHVFDQTGLPLANNSEEQLQMTINYKKELGHSGWNADVRSVWRYESEKTPNTSLLALKAAPNPAFSVWDLYLGLGNAKLRFNLFLKNLLDERFTTNKGVSSDGARVAYGYSRDYQRYLGGSASYIF